MLEKTINQILNISRVLPEELWWEAQYDSCKVGAVGDGACDGDGDDGDDSNGDGDGDDGEHNMAPAKLARLQLLCKHSGWRLKTSQHSNTLHQIQHPQTQGLWSAHIGLTFHNVPAIYSFD